MLDEPTALKVKTRGCPLGSAALTQVSLRGFWSSSLIDGQKKAGFFPLDKLHTSVPYTDYALLLINAFFLMCIAFIPFATALLTKYITSPTNQHTAANV